MRYIFHARITNVERRRRAVRAHKGVGEEGPIVEYEDLGWFLSIDPFAVSVSVGGIEPPWQPGQRITLTLEEAPT